MAMNSWEWIFRQSRVNDGEYYGERLAVRNWDWPRDTWLQNRLRYLRSGNGRHSRELTEEASRRQIYQ
jgi:hypothetical protein